ncbi:hypothetical protein [Pseudomonas sp. BMS12]|uniref:hypothetical protein n=1 Tax=Pseudomonas sp. BMS12 TaxID=1796033 RepID=UPI00128FFE90|nr:hypothetical protein [Pseudomonas sp. BMS12]
MKQKVILALATALGACICIAIGVGISSYAFFALEFNDRLKYEAAYLKGFTKIQRAIKERDYDKAEKLADSLIDAHTHTLSEFDYLATSYLITDINPVICDVISLREEFPTKRGVDSEKASI